MTYITLSQITVKSTTSRMNLKILKCWVEVARVGLTGNPREHLCMNNVLLALATILFFIEISKCRMSRLCSPAGRFSYRRMQNGDILVLRNEGGCRVSLKRDF